ncbi:phage tail assembly protein [Rhizobium leguminosarum bv. viciae USDA 2370]|nr:hypothetical protein BS629_11845 [Rhizobium leguminosarum bv. viciae USDA 2370]PUB61968.1 phage tail assembly protein [Rhizobium leguminosarum bv. viciae USDA 2370]TCA80200.1 phage tail assembly protein [Rhizobium leguminosarum bv. viciae]TCA91104.1 phage tail assembly protein [Rhizobium leguminosarum bv. viciae]
MGQGSQAIGKRAGDRFPLNFQGNDMLADQDPDVKLEAPVEHNGKLLSELRFRAPTIGDIEAAEKIAGGVARSVFLISRLSGVDIAHVRKIPAAYLDNILDQLNDQKGTV